MRKTYYIDGLQNVDRVYFSKGRDYFSFGDSCMLNSYSYNEFSADPEEFVVFESDLRDPEDKVTEDDDSLTYLESPYYSIIEVDDEEFAIDYEKIKKVKDVFYEV